MSNPLPNPYVGPRSFQAGETLYGRDSEADELLNLLIAERIVLLHSPSGAGKTSLVQARIIPSLRENEFHVLPPMRVNLEPPLADAQNRYTLSLLMSLEEALPIEEHLPLSELARLTFSDYLERRATANSINGEVLIFDQFEEILTVDPANIAAKTEFFAQVGQALRNRSRWALFSMREDYVAALAPYLRSIPTRLNCTYRLDLLGASMARQALVLPARSQGVAFDEAAATRLLDDLRRIQVQRPDGSIEEQSGPYVEPVQLQVVAYRLWQGWAARVVQETSAALRIEDADIVAAGDVGKALGDYYAERVAAVAATGVSERSIRDWFDQHLITPQGIRGQVLQGYEQTNGLDNRAIYDLIDAYLLRAEKRRGATWFELAHDRLIEPVRASNAAWRERYLTQAQRTAALWEAQSRPDGLLLRGEELKEAERWAAANPNELSEVEQDFLEACIRQRQIDERERRTNRRIRRLAITASVVGILAVVAAIIATTARNDAERARNESTARQLIAQFQTAKEQFPQLGLLLALEAKDHEGETTAPASISALYHGLAQVGGEAIPGIVATNSPLAFSSDGRWLAAAGLSNTALVWEVSRPSSAPTILSGHTNSIKALAFSPDGRWLATAGDDTTVQLWDMSEQSAEPLVLEGHSNAILALAFSPNGRWLATAGQDGSVRLWNMNDPETEPLIQKQSDLSVGVLAFSPDSRILASGTNAGLIWLWPIERPTDKPTALRGHNAEIKALAFSPDGTRLASASADATARIWNLGLPEANPLLLNHMSPVTGLAFSPDGNSLITNDDSPSTSQWDLSNLTNRPLVYKAYKDIPTTLSFSPNGTSIVATSNDHIVRLWRNNFSSDPTLLLGHESDVRALAFSPDSIMFATADTKGQVRLWDVYQPRAIRHVPVGALSLAYSPNGKLMANGSDNGKVLLYNSNQFETPLFTLDIGRRVRSWSLSFSPNGQRLAVGGDGQVQLWELTDPDEPLATFDLTGLPEFKAGSPNILALGVLPQEQVLVAVGMPNNEGMILRLDSNNPNKPVSLFGTLPSLSVVAFSPDASQVALRNLNDEIVIYDTSRPTAEPKVIDDRALLVTKLAFSDDFRNLAAGDSYGKAYIWTLERSDAEPVVLSHKIGAFEIASLAFSPDKLWLLSRSMKADKILLWDLRNTTLEPIVIEPEAGTQFNTVAFTPDNTYIVTGDKLGIRLWPRSGDELEQMACSIAGRNMTINEWQQAFGINVSYHKTCPDWPISTSLIDSAATLVTTGEVLGALEHLDRVRTLNAVSEIPAASWDSLCMHSIVGRASSQFIFACDQAVNLAPNNGSYHKSRGIARALNQDYVGATDDLQQYLTWARSTGQDLDQVEECEQWITALEQGQNPITIEVQRQIADELESSAKD